MCTKLSFKKLLQSSRKLSLVSAFHLTVVVAMGRQLCRASTLALLHDWDKKQQPHLFSVWHIVPVSPRYWKEDTVQVICDGLDLVREIVKIVKFSKTLFQSKSTEKEEATGSGTIFMPLCPTRWTIRTAAIDSALKQYSIIMETMTDNTRWIMTSNQVVFLLLPKTFHTIWLAVRSSFVWSSREYFQGIAGKGFVCTRGLSCATLLKSFYERHRTDNSFETFMRLQMHLVLSWKSTASPSHVITSDQNNSIAAVNHTDLTTQKYGFHWYTLKLVTSSLVNSLLI